MIACSGGIFSEFYTRPQTGKFYIINEFENQWLSVAIGYDAVNPVCLLDV